MLRSCPADAVQSGSLRSLSCPPSGGLVLRSFEIQLAFKLLSKFFKCKCAGKPELVRSDRRLKSFIRLGYYFGVTFIM
jgi:hypothetical protein